MRKLYSLAAVFMLASCSTSHYCYVVRHAEKLDSTPRSVLSETGHQRARVLRDSLINKKIELIFATYFKRTQETAQPLAEVLKITPVIYRNNAVDSIVTVLKANRNKNILLVGHSGNLPAILEGVTGKKVEPITESEYDNLYVIKSSKKGVELIKKKYGSQSGK